MLRYIRNYTDLLQIRNGTLDAEIFGMLLGTNLRWIKGTVEAFYSHSRRVDLFLFLGNDFSDRSFSFEIFFATRFPKRLDNYSTLYQPLSWQVWLAG